MLRSTLRFRGRGFRPRVWAEKLELRDGTYVVSKRRASVPQSEASLSIFLIDDNDSTSHVAKLARAVGDYLPLVAKVLAGSKVDVQVTLYVAATCGEAFYFTRTIRFEAKLLAKLGELGVELVVEAMPVGVAPGVEGD